MRNVGCWSGKSRAWSQTACVPSAFVAFLHIQQHFDPTKAYSRWSLPVWRVIILSLLITQVHFPPEGHPFVHLLGISLLFIPPPTRFCWVHGTSASPLSREWGSQVTEDLIPSNAALGCPSWGYGFSWQICACVNSAILLGMCVLVVRATHIPRCSPNKKSLF